MAVPGDMIFFCDKEFTTCDSYEANEIEEFAKTLKAVDEATSDEDIMDYFKENISLLDVVFNKYKHYQQ